MLRNRTLLAISLTVFAAFIGIGMVGPVRVLYAQSSGASVRNFGFINVTGQERGAAWTRARRTCAIWEEVAQAAGIPILQRGLWMTTRRPEAVAILESFLKTEMGEGCTLLSRAASVCWRAIRCLDSVT